MMPHNNDDYLPVYCVCRSSLLLKDVREALDARYQVTTVCYSSDHEECFLKKVYTIPLKDLLDWINDIPETIINIEKYIED